MASDKSGRTPHPFDVATVEKLIGLMTDHDLSEVDLHDGDSRIRLRRGAKTVTVAASPGLVAPVAPMAAPATAAATAATASPSVAAVADGKKYYTITSPTPGTFYAKPSPDEPAYVKVGSKVTNDSVVCKIEAMKIFNDITADCAGTIVEVLVDNAQPVEYGQPLFKVDLG